MLQERRRGRIIRRRRINEDGGEGKEELDLLTRALALKNKCLIFLNLIYNLH